ncbi:MAG TPA: hypothetical protein VK140_01285 [Ktedonobacteraceae bacterium]|nr:hypothetical protein [Ktedonobacteraceae bacterium]
MSLQEHLGTPSTFFATPAPSSSSPCSWVPLEGTAQLWATFAGTFLTYPAFTVTSAVFSALSLEAGALQQYNHACHSRLNGDDLHARTACEQTMHDLQESSSQWMSALYWLERLASDKRYPLDTEERTSLGNLFSEATEQLQRVGVLTQQIQEACVLCYQQHGILGHKEEGEQS